MVATEYDGDGEGRLPDPDSIAYVLHSTEAEVEAAIVALVGQKLIDVDGEGNWRMHDYAQWQEGESPTPEPPVAPSALAKRKAAIAKVEKDPDAERKLHKLQELIEGLCEGLQMDARELGSTYGRWAKAFQGMAANGQYCRDDMRKLAQFVQTTDYWRERRATPTPEAILGQVGAWKASGMPDRWSPGMRQGATRPISTATAAQLRSQG
jgi:hypothetical protein